MLASAWQFLGRCYNECYEEGILPDSQRQAVLSLIFKKGKVDDIVNYRPISLRMLIIEFWLSLWHNECKNKRET